MADLPQGVSTYQSGTNDTATILVNNVSPMNASQMNGAYDAIIQMQAILGAGPDLKGSMADLAARLAVQMSASGILLPIGCIIMHGGALPALFTEADGAAISRTGIYANLFAVYGTTFGAGDGSTTFNKPDFRGRLPVGLGSGTGGGSSGVGAPTGGTALANILMGSWRGEENHVLSSAEMPSHVHGVTDPGHSHTQQGASGGPGANRLTIDTHDTNASVNQTSSDATGISIQATGGGNAHNVINPQLGVRFIIKY
jgi:microcystin-dependent protein